MVSKSLIVWMYGLSGSGKSTLADKIRDIINSNSTSCEGVLSVHLDADEVRNGLNSDLGFSTEDRMENIRRLAHLASTAYHNLSKTHNVVIFVSAITPFLEMRQRVEDIFRVEGCEHFFVYCASEVETCRKRDVKGMYSLADEGRISRFTGVSHPFHKPTIQDPISYVADTENGEVDVVADMLLSYIISYSEGGH